MPNINRRTFITGLTAISSLSMISNAGAHQNSPFTVSYQHGVASGDPLQTKVILWTRISFDQKPGARGQTIRVQWQVSNNAQFTDIVSQGATTTSAKRDYTVKVDADHLKPDSRYFYRFICNQIISPTGRTRTLADHSSDNSDVDDANQAQQAELAVVSCSNYGYGYFNVYQEISQQDNLTAVLHLGDYIYEYANDVYSDPELANKERSILPLTEITRLADYRQRYNIYRLDSQLQAAHAAHPLSVSGTITNLPMTAGTMVHKTTNQTRVTGISGDNLRFRLTESGCQFETLLIKTTERLYTAVLISVHWPV
ncbi:MAG: PhoD-like phosphatase N-terminal domain-containing protein [Arenicella sp.]|nr:PhoD-like phosphatase N-terminal domain-containing protein [Arenicella sp.]